MKQHCTISNAILFLERVKWQEKAKKIVTRVRGRKYPKQVHGKTGIMLTDIPRSERVAKFI